MKQQVVTKMKATEINKGGYTLYDHHFDSLLDLVYYLENTKPITQSDSSKTGDYSFTGTHSYEEAMDMCKNGYFSPEVEKFQKIFFKVANQIDRKMKRLGVKHDVVGGVPDVPRYLMGHPLNMMAPAIRPMEKKPKPINLRFNTAASCGTSKSSIERRGLTFVLLYQLLDKLGCNVRLETDELTRERSYFVNIGVELMKKGDIMNISKIYFPLVHPSFLRRIMFATEERLPVLKSRQEFFRGYGQPENLRHYIKFKDETLKKEEINIFSDDYSYGSVKNALKEIIKQIGDEGGLKTPTEQVMELLDEIDFSPLSKFNDDDNYRMDEDDFFDWL